MKLKKLFELKRGQASVEYVVLVGFITFVIIGILSLALIYTGSVRDSIRMNQIISYSNKVISSAESVFYAGAPSKITIAVHLPEGIETLEIVDDNLVFTVHTSTGLSRVAFQSSVPISGSLDNSQGLRKIQILAQAGSVVLSHP